MGPREGTGLARCCGKRICGEGERNGGKQMILFYKLAYSFLKKVGKSAIIPP
jgi:hypothetical protein